MEGTAVPFVVVMTLMMIEKTGLKQIVEGFLSETDYYLVDLIITPENKIIIEIDAFEGVSLDFCANLNKFVESKLNRDDEDFELEVSSAGITQPFKVLKQYEKNIGNEVETVTKSGLKLSGVLKEVQPDFFVLETEKKVKTEDSKRKVTVVEDQKFTYQEIKTTKYIIRFK